MYLFISFFFISLFSYLFIYMCVRVCVCTCVCIYVCKYIYIYVYVIIYLFIFYLFIFFPSLACQKDITCYLNQNLAQCRWVYSYKIYNKDSLQYVYLYNSPWLRGKWRRSFLISQYHFKNSLAVAFKIFSFVCTVCFCMLGVFLLQDRRLEQKFR